MSKQHTARFAEGFSFLLLACLLLASAPRSTAQPPKDPGPRPNPQSLIPAPIPGLNVNELTLFNETLLRISELEGTCDTCAQQPEGQLPIDGCPNNPFSPCGLVNSAGIGPVFNADQCISCHIHPVLGGGSPAQNPAHQIATRQGALNTVPSFEKSDGAFREVRFKYNPDGSRDGGVTSLFTVRGRRDAPNCNLMQPDFETAYQKANVAFRIPLSLFGLGLIESIPDRAIRANMAANAALKQSLGIGGKPNMIANTGTISRFGWKAQNGSINVFAGEAYNVEMGITNDLFPITRNEEPGCNVAYEPFDIPRTKAGFYENPVKIIPAWLMFTVFMRFVDAPRPVVLSPTAQLGRQQFNEIGCALCHAPSFQIPGTATPSDVPEEQVGPSTVALRGKTVNLYSDLLLHKMGATLADNIIQGAAGPDEFRTTPLWGIGQRLFFLHDGRTADLMTAIQDHYSAAGSDGGDNPAKDQASSGYGASEANAVIDRFNALADAKKQAILDFLRSL
ncbi:di-heme oxidoredictase family protein [uncultured Paludibaculum sp.]|uniref:di-heme oxidoredictase family protein n=1 Tax=uncultured Paludibaculum sp. TaxID=1765020 RepID=UPI002AAC0852|nr:di-heme oxidoredictase family protein [uncultured Paludibaculum sp.]